MIWCDYDDSNKEKFPITGIYYQNNNDLNYDSYLKSVKLTFEPILPGCKETVYICGNREINLDQRFFCGIELKMFKIVSDKEL